MGLYDPEQVVRDVGRRIAELRVARGLTQIELADRLRYSVQHVSQLENGTNVTIFTLARIANALGAPLAELMVPPNSRERRQPGRPRREAAGPPSVVAETTRTHDYARVPQGAEGEPTGSRPPPTKRRSGK